VLDRDNVNALATGVLTTYDSQIDVTTGTIKMRATFDNPNGVLFPQQFVNVRLLVDTMTGATLAPNAAIQLGASGNFVYLLSEDSTVLKRDVTIGPSDGKRTVIASGLKAGDQVVIDGVDRLRDGAKVKVVDSPATPVAEAAPGQHDGAAQQAADPPSSPAGEGEHHRHRERAQTGAGASAPTP
jgi:membrane fusion protein, multidrug efflux system